MADTGTDHGYPVLRFRKSVLVIGPKFWVACGIAVVLVGVGVLVSPSNKVAGVGIGVAGVLGALLQPAPLPRDFTANGASAVRGLLAIAEDIDNARRAATQLAQVEPENVRMTIGLIDVQDRLLQVRPVLFTSMAEWDAIAPGSLDEVDRLLSKGRRALEILVKENDGDD